MWWTISILGAAQTSITGWLEAFAAHPKLGDKHAVREKFSKFRELSSQEQSGIADEQSEELISELAAWNAKYEVKHKFIFILCATGKSANDVLQALKHRYANTPLTELKIAAQQQMAITELRLAAAFAPQPAACPAGAAARRTDPPARSPITSHVLDTAVGKPAANLTVSLYRACEGARLEDDMWALIREEDTNSDGRATTLMRGGVLEPGLYRVKFDTEKYFQATGQGRAFYPQPVVDFTVSEETRHQHFHIPLLICPYAYSTYRGS